MRPVWPAVHGRLVPPAAGVLTGVNTGRSPLAVTIITIILYPERSGRPIPPNPSPGPLQPGGEVTLPCQRD